MLYLNEINNYNNFDIFSETYKIPTQKFNLINDHYVCNFELISNSVDAITNIYLLCDNNKIDIVSIKLYTYNYDKTKLIYNLKYNKTENGYKIININNFVVIPMISIKHTDIEITISQNDIVMNELYINNFDVKLDRILLNYDIKNKLINNHLHLITNKNYFNLNNLLNTIKKSNTQMIGSLFDLIFKSNPSTDLLLNDTHPNNDTRPIKKQKTSKVPKHTGYDTAGLERAVAYLQKLDSEISKAMRMDLDGALDANLVEEIRGQIEDGIEKLHSRLSKVLHSKKTKKNNKEKKSQY
jgi:hypothetical protein